MWEGQPWTYHLGQDTLWDDSMYNSWVTHYCNMMGCEHTWNVMLLWQLMWCDRTGFMVRLVAFINARYAGDLRLTSNLNYFINHKWRCHCHSSICPHFKDVHASMGITKVCVNLPFHLQLSIKHMNDYSDSNEAPFGFQIEVGCSCLTRLEWNHTLTWLAMHDILETPKSFLCCFFFSQLHLKDKFMAESVPA